MKVINNVENPQAVYQITSAGTVVGLTSIIVGTFNKQDQMLAGKSE